MRHRPRVHKNKSLVCVYHEGLGMFEVYKITKKGKVSRKYSPRTVYSDDVKEAFRNMDVAFAGFKIIPKTKKIKAKANNWYEYIEMVWELAKKKK